MSTKKQLFDTGSPGFLHSIIVFVLGLFAASGVSFPKEVSILGMDIITSFSTGGVWAIIGILVTSIAFPIYNWVKSGGKFNLSFLFSKTSNVLALLYVVMSAVALTGFVLPDGTIEAIVNAVQVQDWGALGGLIFGPVLSTFIRWLKDRKTTTA